MLYFSADPRDGGTSGAVCDECCCKPISLRPGETNLMQINYAPWSVPIGSPGIVPTMDFSIVTRSENCPTSAIDGFIPPSNTNYSVTTLAGTAVVVDSWANLVPAENDFTNEIVPMFGPFYGTVTQPEGATEGDISYTPLPGFQGWDVVWFKTTDAQGRSIIRSISIKVGVTVGAAPRQFTAMQPFIESTQISTDSRMQMIRFPIYMPLSCRPCDEYRLTIKQPAINCERQRFFHLSCYDIRCRDCL